MLVISESVVFALWLSGVSSIHPKMHHIIASMQDVSDSFEQFIVVYLVSISPRNFSTIPIEAHDGALKFAVPNESKCLSHTSALQLLALENPVHIEICLAVMKLSQ